MRENRFRKGSCFLLWTFAVYTGCAEYADEISHLGCLRAVFLRRSVSQAQLGADGGQTDTGRERLIFNRSADLCHDVFKHPTNLAPSSSAHNEWMNECRISKNWTSSRALGFSPAALGLVGTKQGYYSNDFVGLEGETSFFNVFFILILGNCNQTINKRLISSKHLINFPIPWFFAFNRHKRW